MSSNNGITQSPFADAVVPTHDAGSGDQGIGGGLDLGGGANGITNTPWSNPVVPVPAGGVESGPFGNPSRFASVDGGTHQGDSELAPIGNITGSRNTIDRR